MSGAGLDLSGLAGATVGAAPLGEEVRDPERIPGRAVAIALAVVLVVCAAVVVVVLGVLGTTTTATSALPLRDAVAAGLAVLAAGLVGRAFLSPARRARGRG